MRLMLISHTLIRSDGMGSCHFPSVTGRQCARVDWTSSCSRSPVGRNIDLHYIVLVYIYIYILYNTCGGVKIEPEEARSSCVVSCVS